MNREEWLAARRTGLGDRHGRLRIVAPAERRGGKAFWRCECDCGNVCIVRETYLKNGHTKSCGCLCVERSRQAATRHGLSRTPEYLSWKKMLERCYNPNHDHYDLYGGRGIAVCERWRNSVEAFVADLGKCPGDGYTVERKNTNGDYSPENCEWATRKTQCRNKRNNRLVTCSQLTMCAREWDEYRGFPAGTVSGRLFRGWSEERAVCEEVKRLRLYRKVGT